MYICLFVLFVYVWMNIFNGSYRHMCGVQACRHVCVYIYVYPVSFVSVYVMHVCVCTFVYYSRMHACMYAGMYTWSHAWCMCASSTVCMFACASSPGYLSLCLSVCRYVDMYVCMYVCVFACVCMHVYVCMCVYVHVCKCLHTWLYIYVYHTLRIINEFGPWGHGGDPDNPCDSCRAYVFIHAVKFNSSTSALLPAFSRLKSWRRTWTLWIFQLPVPMLCSLLKLFRLKCRLHGLRV